MKLRLLACIAAFAIPSTASGAVYLIEATGNVRMTQGSDDVAIFVGDTIAGAFKLDDRSFGAPARLPLGGGIYSIYSTILTSFQLTVGTFRTTSSIIPSTVTFMNDSFGQDGIVIAPERLPKDFLGSDLALVQFQFRGPTTAIGPGGLANGLPFDRFQSNFFGVFGAGTGQRRVFGDLQVSIRSAVPEPTAWMMLLLGCATIGSAARYRRAKVISALI